MADKISAYGRAGLDISQARQREVNKTDKAAESASGNRPEPGQDAVDVSSTASFLKTVEQRLREQPDVDQARVDELSRRIQSGQYEVSPERLAARLLRLEQGLG